MRFCRELSHIEQGRRCDSSGKTIGGDNVQCVTPMFYRYKLGEKKKGKIVPRQEVMHDLIMDPNSIRKCLEAANKNMSNYKYIKVPCNHCWACQLKYSAEWATRIMLESQKYEQNYYITLTYDQKNVPIAEQTSWEQYDPDPEDPHGPKIKTKQTRENDGTWGYTLYPEDMNTFINSLRKRFERKGHEGIKYFYCGEYGTETQRPHYHIILMNVPLNETKFYDPWIDDNWKAHWKSTELEELWGKGIIDVCELEWSCAAYVARYCTKKIELSGDKTIYLENGKFPEFIRMSKGIGFDYFEKHYKEIYKNDELILKTIKGNAGSIKPPRAYDKRLEEADPELYRKIKKSREKASKRTDQILQSITDYTDMKMLEIAAGNLETKMSMLPRTGDW